MSAKHANFKLRLATLADSAAISELIALSARIIGRQDYSEAQIEGALRSAFGLDTQLIRDECYFVAERDDHIVACGGWSFRKTLFGNDAESARDSQKLNPGTDAAKIRAFFVHPDYARQGIGSLIMLACEQAAIAAGFRSLELMATLSGERLYRRHGFLTGDPVDYDLGDGLTITFLPMTRQID